MTFPGQPDTGRGFRRWGAVLAWIGGVLLVVSIAAGAILGFTGIRGTISEFVDEGERFTGTTTVTLEADQSMQLYKRQGDVTPTCTIDAPGAREPGPGPTHSSTVTTDGTTWTSFRSFKPMEDGEYTLRCDGGEVTVAPPLSGSGLAIGIGAIVLGIFGAIAGAALLVVGLVLFFIGRSRRPRTA